MFLKYVLGAVLYVGTVCAMDWPTQLTLFENQQEFSDINSLAISSDSGDIVIQPSLSGKTVISCDKQAEIIREENRLIVKGPQQNRFFSFFSSTYKFRITIPVDVTDLKVSTGKGCIIIDGAHLNQLNISGGKVHVLLKEMKGHVNIKSGSCVLKYLATSLKKGQNAVFNCISGSLDFTAYLSDVFTGFCLLLKSTSLQIKESFLPTTAENNADIVLRGECGAVKVSIRKDSGK